jgi:hypothetical protein
MSTALSSLCHLTPKVFWNDSCPTSFLYHGNNLPDEILLICLVQENREMYPKVIMTRMRWQIGFGIEDSLHTWKRHPCILTVDRQLTGWHEQVATWCDLCWLLYSQSSIVCLLIQSNCIELQPSVNNLVWVAWLFHYPVWKKCGIAIIQFRCIHKFFFSFFMLNRHRKWNDHFGFQLRFVGLHSLMCKL